MTSISAPVRIRKKLIEVALPLEAINIASAREKSIRHGHPSTLHLWWARRPLATARAVIFAQMVDDPSEYVDTLLRDPTKKRAAEKELKKRHALWVERTRYAEALGNGTARRGDGTTGRDAGPFESPAITASNATAHESAASVPIPDTQYPIPGASPGPEPTVDDCLADIERERLFEIIRKLVLWENTTNEKVLQPARDEIWQSWRRTCAENADHPHAAELFDRNKLPAFHDPFAGGGALPLEAQRLGLEAHASDLNPVAVLINKAMIEIPPKFAGMPPVNPESRLQQEQMGKTWTGAQGLAEDVRYYGKWMRDEAEKRIGHLYPKVEITAEMVNERPDLKQYLGKHLTVVAWIWARTVKSPNPAFANVDVPLASTFMLCTKPGKETYVVPIIGRDSYRFEVRIGKPNDAEGAHAGTKLEGANFACLMSQVPISGDYIKDEGKARRMGARLMAVVLEGERGRAYLAPTVEQEAAAIAATVTWKPDGDISAHMTGGNCTPYGLTSWSDLFTPRQLVSLSTFSELVQDVQARVKSDAGTAGLQCDDKHLRDGGKGATAYGESVTVYAAISLDKCADYNSAICGWISGGETLRSTFGRQAIPMTWDFCEANILGGATGSYAGISGQVSRALDTFPANSGGMSAQHDAQTAEYSGRIVSTDPPYYDNIGYADLSDFFYVWLRRSLRNVFPILFATLAVPKAEELIANRHRHGSRDRAEKFFLSGMTQAMSRLSAQAHLAFPITIYYAFKQAETGHTEGSSNSGWDTFLSAVIRSGLAITGTWPARTEREGRSIGIGTNALASSIVLVCRKCDSNAPTITRRDFVTALKSELPIALTYLQRGNIAPVDLAQAAIGPGMAVYTRYARVIDAGGNSVSVREALSLINQTLDEALAEQEGDFDADTRWALAWFEQFGFAEGEYGVAETLSKAKNTSVSGMVDAGIVESGRGNVRLLKPAELASEWEPAEDQRLTAWETVHQLIRALEGERTDTAAAELIAKLGAKADTARELAYRLYNLCERKKRAPEALSYNNLVQSWSGISALAREQANTVPVQIEMTDLE